MHDTLVSFPLFLLTKSLPDPFLIFGVKTSLILVYPFPVACTVMSSVISVAFLVLCTIGSLAAGELLLVNFIPLFTTGFENFEVSQINTFQC